MAAPASTVPSATPPTKLPRIDQLDLLRGVAMLGILVMNAVSFGLGEPAYFRLDAAGWSSIPDKVVGVAAEVLVDQKMMGLFSMLFGASIVLFVDRVGARRKHPVWFALWRNLLLLGIGLAHSAIWEGDVLTVYALSAPAVLVMRRLPVRVLYGIGGLLFTSTIVLAIVTQASVDGEGAQSLGWIWESSDLASGSDAVIGWFLFDGVARALGAMVIGVALYRSGVLTGKSTTVTYRRMATVGFGLGIPVAVAGVVWQLATGFDPGVALTSGALNTAATIPMTIGYVGSILTWSLARPGGHAGSLQVRLRAVGQMALTNYLTQTMLGLLVLRGLFERGSVGRAGLMLFVAAVWVLQLAWSKPWLARYTNGPAEWLWRTATYLRVQPFRRATAAR